MSYLKSLVCIVLLLLTSNQSFSQKGQEKHHRARIFFNGQDQEDQLGELGIELDHGLLKKGVFIECDFSVSELNRVQNHGFQYEILIDDVAKHYAQQNAKPTNDNFNKNASCVGNASTYPKPANFNLGSMGGFFTYEEIMSQMDLMATLYPNIVKAKSPVSTFETFEGRSIYWMKISDNPNTDEGEPEILYDAIHHAREPASVASLLYYMWYLLENYDTNDEIKAIVDNSELYFIPLVNPDGYRYNQTTNPNGGGLWRKNRRNHGNGNFGVDNNRNYGVEWGTTGISFNTSSDVYCGTSAFSEPENQAMKWFCENHDFKMAFNNHTYGNLLLYPFGYEVNQPTPDNTLFQSISAEMVSENNFTNQLSAELYPASGDSDDWMYIETAEKSKILAFTPEIGSNSFWPASSQIIPICQSTMFMNITAAHMISKYAEIQDLSGPVIPNLTGSFDIDIRRLGLEGGTFIVELLPAAVPTAIVSTSAPQTITLNQLQNQVVTVSFELSPNVIPGQQIDFSLFVDNGDYPQVVSLSKTFGTANNILSDNGSDLNNWNAGGWGTTNSTFESAPTSITDSPSGNYANNTNSSITLVDELDLTNAISADLSFYARWDIEATWDYVQIEVSTDNGSTWTPQCGNFTGVGGPNQATGEPLYDGTQNTWVQEQISLSDYLGENIKLRFQLVTDGAVAEDGFYFDELKVNVIAPSTPGGLDLSVKTILEGAYDPATALMTDVLRSNNHIPLIEPYTGFGYAHAASGGGEVTTNAVLSNTGNNAIVDWVIVEVRDASSPSNVIVSKSALLQRDGDIVDVDGFSPLHFDDAGSTDILVAVRHRNHFGVRNLMAFASSGAQSIDFSTAATQTFGIDALKDVSGIMMQIAADANGDGQVNTVDKNINWRLENGLPFEYTINKADFNLDGTVNSVDKNGLWRTNNSKTEQLD